MTDKEHSELKDDAPQEHRIRSFVIRAGRITSSQLKALEELGPKYLVDTQGEQELDLVSVFDRDAPPVLEIGFGMGKSFVEMASADPLSNYLGIEVHPPGVGACLKLIEEQGLTNVRVIKYDAFAVLSHCLRKESVDRLQIFFPDPWPKKRHIKRRLINDEFIREQVYPVLRHGGQIRMATDWEDYAMQMLEVMTHAEGFVNTSPDGTFIPRPDWRPLTKFELRGQRLGHGVWDLVFEKV